MEINNKENIIERKLFVDKEVYDLFVRYAKQTNQPVSTLFRHFMSKYALFIRKELNKQQDEVCLSSPQPPIMGEVVEDKTSLSKNL